MEKFNKPVKKFRKKELRKFYCELCERMVVKSHHIKTRKNYSHGRKSKPTITKLHRQCGGCLIEVKKKR